MDPIDDLRQRTVSTAARDEGAMARPLAPMGRLIIQPTSMSRVVWRISAGRPLSAGPGERRIANRGALLMRTDAQSQILSDSPVGTD